MVTIEGIVRVITVSDEHRNFYHLNLNLNTLNSIASRSCL